MLRNALPLINQLTQIIVRDNKVLSRLKIRESLLLSNNNKITEGKKEVTFTRSQCFECPFLNLAVNKTITMYYCSGFYGSAGLSWVFSALIGVCHLRLHTYLEAPLIENIQESPFTCMRVSAGISWELGMQNSAEC